MITLQQAQELFNHANDALDSTDFFTLAAVMQSQFSNDSTGAPNGVLPTPVASGTTLAEVNQLLTAASALSPVDEANLRDLIGGDPSFAVAADGSIHQAGGAIGSGSATGSSTSSLAVLAIAGLAIWFFMRKR